MAQVKDEYYPNSVNRQVYDYGFTLYNKLFHDLNECFDATV